MTPAPGIGPSRQRVRGRVADHDRFALARVGPDEREHLAVMGGLLRAARVAAGLSARTLAAEAGAGIATVSDLERGAVRPRPRMLADLAAVLDPSGTAGLHAALVDLAGASLRPDTTAGVRRRRRRVAAVRRRRAQLARTANGLIRRSQDTMAALTRLNWSSGALASTSLPAIRTQLQVFETALDEHQDLRRQADEIAAHLRRRPATTPDTVIVAVAEHLGSTGRTAPARRVADHQ